LDLASFRFRIIGLIFFPKLEQQPDDYVVSKQRVARSSVQSLMRSCANVA
jgi:hypothetical protein